MCVRGGCGNFLTGEDLGGGGSSMNHSLTGLFFFKHHFALTYSTHCVRISPQWLSELRRLWTIITWRIECELVSLIGPCTVGVWMWCLLENKSKQFHKALVRGYSFSDCSYWQRSASGHVTGPESMASLGLPCNISAALQAPDGATYYFKGDHFWKYTADQRLSAAKSVLDWSADFLWCWRSKRFKNNNNKKTENCIFSDWAQKSVLFLLLFSDCCTNVFYHVAIFIELTLHKTIAKEFCTRCAILWKKCLFVQKREELSKGDSYCALPWKSRTRKKTRGFTSTETI